MTGNNIKDVKEAMEAIIKRTPDISASRIANYLKVPKQTILWLAEDLKHKFYD